MVENKQVGLLVVSTPACLKGLGFSRCRVPNWVGREGRLAYCSAEVDISGLPSQGKNKNRNVQDKIDVILVINAYDIDFFGWKLENGRCYSWSVVRYRKWLCIVRDCGTSVMERDYFFFTWWESTARPSVRG